MVLHLAVFALAGLGFARVAWLVLPRSEQDSFAASMLSGAVGSLLGGLITWHNWPPRGDELHTVALLTALLGAGAVFWAHRAYARFEGADE